MVPRFKSIDTQDQEKQNWEHVVRWEDACRTAFVEVPMPLSTLLCVYLADDELDIEAGNDEEALYRFPSIYRKECAARMLQ